MLSACKSFLYLVSYFHKKTKFYRGVTPIWYPTRKRCSKDVILTDLLYIFPVTGVRKRDKIDIVVRAPLWYNLSSMENSRSEITSSDFGRFAVESNVATNSEGNQILWCVCYSILSLEGKGTGQPTHKSNKNWTESESDFYGRLYSNQKT